MYIILINNCNFNQLLPKLSFSPRGLWLPMSFYRMALSAMLSTIKSRQQRYLQRVLFSRILWMEWPICARTWLQCRISRRPKLETRPWFKVFKPQSKPWMLKFLRIVTIPMWRWTSNQSYVYVRVRIRIRVHLHVCAYMRRIYVIINFKFDNVSVNMYMPWS